VPGAFFRKNISSFIRVYRMLRNEIDLGFIKANQFRR
jgi:hypothetical protein